jgi:hypothetical protein
VDAVVPIVGVVVGGVLAMLGSLVVQRTTRRAERRDLLRQKLEELYRLSTQLTEWASDQVELSAILALSMTQGASAGQSALQQGSHVARTTDDLIMTARFYHPSLEAEVRALDSQADELTAAAESFERHLMTRPEPFREVEPELLDPVTEAFDRLRDLVKAFQLSLAREATKYI